MSYTACERCGSPLQSGEGSPCTNEDCYTRGGSWNVRPSDIEKATAERAAASKGADDFARSLSKRERRSYGISVAKTPRDRAFKGLVGRSKR